MYCNDNLHAAFWHESVLCIFGKPYP